MNGLRSLLAAVVCLAIPVLAAAQGFQSGTLAVMVEDQSGSALPGVTVTLTSQDRGSVRTAISDSAGRANFPVLQVGLYRVDTSLEGFQPMQRVNNKVDAEKMTEIRMQMRVGGVGETITVTGQQPVVDRTNVAATTTLAKRELETLPMGRSYQTVYTFAPGVVDQPGNASSGNPQVHGGLASSNVFLFDGVDTTDTTTGTFGSNLNYEAIEEVVVQSAGMSAEYGRATGGVFNVITKSGTNNFDGSLKAVQTNDSWDSQNKTVNQVTGASLARTKDDKNNYRYSATLGGPIWRDRAWFFGAYEKAETRLPPQQTTVTNEEYQQNQVIELPSYRVTAQITPSHSIFAKYGEDPFSGIVRDYWGGAPELFSLTGQSQGGEHTSAQYSGVFSQSITAEAIWAESSSIIVVEPYRVSPLHNGAPHKNEGDQKYYNGATFDGFVERPRKQMVGALSYFTTIAGNSHNFKGGVDWQDLASSNFFRYPNSQLFVDESFDPVTRAYVPKERKDFIDAPSTSTGTITAIYFRDKFDIGRRMFIEAGLRAENEKSETDLGATAVDSTTIAPRFQASYDLRGDGRMILAATLGRFYQSINQNFADSYAGVPQQANYDLYEWNGTDYVFVDDIRVGGAASTPPEDLKPVYTDEFTAGVQRQLGATMGAGVRYVHKTWGDLIDDVNTFDADGNVSQTFTNVALAKRTYNGLELSFEKRFSSNWNLLANYTYSQTRGNHFAQLSSSLGNFQQAQCRSTVDPTIGNNGAIPCNAITARLDGRPTYDLPHLLNILGGYSRTIGPVRLSAGTAFRFSSGNSFSKSRTLDVLAPDGSASGQTVTYYYEGLGSDRGPSWNRLDTSLEATWRMLGVEIGAKGEVFNVFDTQEANVVSNTAYCGNINAPAGSTCATARANFGTYTSRGAYMTPRNFRFTALVRF